ncbi:MAG: TVP38/TMEM64 family protein [Syntrophorhabdaceae bacterium]|nr:TVP38/TMEM64 family protein [Syntrophorhabdaceae bacterium]MDD5243270.1 TVP38/TMEM64 family protein [Syntrophorhabdaceae bacterium]
MLKHKKKIIIAVLFIGGIVFLRVSGIGQYLTFENFLQQKEALHQHVRDHYISSILWFIILYIVVVALSIPGGAVLSIAGGFLFGTVLGVIYTNIGATLGAVCIFLITRYLIGNWLQEKYRERLIKFNNEMERHGPNYFLTLRFIPLFPFFLVNIFAGLTRIPFGTFLWTTAAGILPGDFVYTFAGSQLNTLRSIKDIFSVNIMIALALLALFSLVPVMYNHLKRAR